MPKRRRSYLPYRIAASDASRMHVLQPFPQGWSFGSHARLRMYVVITDLGEHTPSNTKDDLVVHVVADVGRRTKDDARECALCGFMWMADSSFHFSLSSSRFLMTMSLEGMCEDGRIE